MTHLSIDSRARITARSEPIADPGDLLDHLAPGGFAWIDGACGFVTAGVAASMAPDRAEAALDAIAHERAPGTPGTAGPRAVGALPFQGAGRLVIPARIVARDAGGPAWCTTISEVDPPAPLSVATPPPSRFDVHASTTRDEWDAAVRDALASIRRGELDKVVLARTVGIDADAPFDRRDVLALLRAGQPGCRVYADGGFVGASPELLVQRRGARVVARPLAGTGDDPARLLASAKDAWEHRVVVDDVARHLRETCGEVEVDGPAAVRFADVTHLATTITARSGRESALALARSLHPTPAVGGSPRDAALAAIARLESFDRDHYAGPCGWVDARGDGEFVVALRGAALDGARARLYAGAGIVAGSDPAAEWAETQAKLEPMLRVLVRP